ncbi:MAG: LysM peptidoglycan-binding domain-containing protein [Anaerolineae bacterium]|nr:LysM peptidoglycan-binding domain-containing protein [Anaerolineae bacterium]
MMSRQSQTPDHKGDRDRKPKQIIKQSGQGLEPVAMTMPALSSATDNVRDQANTLNNPRLSLLQRQIIAGQIGQIGGNKYLQRLMVQMKQDETAAESQSTEKQEPLMQRTGHTRITENTLPGGQRQQVIRMPFSQVISRSSEDVSADSEEQTAQEETIFIDELLGAEEDEVSDDTISTSLTYTPTIERGGPAPGGTEFGVTNSSASLTGVRIVPSPGVYHVSGELVLKIQWEARSGTGPGGQIDIQDENDPDVKACNYQLVASDLTPDMSSDNGRPPRTEFWAEDLTIRHELFHASDQRALSWGPQRVTAIENWLNSQTATSATEIRDTLLSQALAEGQRVFNALASAPAAEGDAYGDGAPLYQARADAVKAKGDVGDYGLISTEVTILPKGGEEYEIVEGDTLWDIAERTYGHGRYWRDIHRANPGKARNGGNLIFPGQIFDLPSIVMEQDLSISLTLDSKIYISETVRVSGSQIFFVLPSDVFSDATNCDGDVTIDLWDADGNSLLTAVWTLPGSVNSGDSNYEVAADIVS